MSNAPSTTGVIELDAQFPDQDFILINGEEFPAKAVADTTQWPGGSMSGSTRRGRAIVQNVTSPRGWDERKGYAITGATLIPTGNPLADFSIRFEFWDPADMPPWYSFAAKYFDESVRFDPGTQTPRALGIFHPVLAAPPIRITQVVVTNATGIEKDDTGLHFCEVSFKRYRKLKQAQAAPAAAIPAAASSQPTAQDAADLEIQQLMKQYGLLAGPVQ